MGVRFAILGSLEVRLDGDPVQMPGPRRGALLARLIVAHGRAVPVDVLIDDLWAGSPPAAAEATLQSHVSALRRIAGAERIERVGRSYRLTVAHDELDATLAADDLAAARLRLQLGDHAEATQTVERALGRWRGPSLADVADQPWALAEVAALEDLRAQCLETLLEAFLAAGRPEAVVTPAEAAIGDYPLRERLWAHLIVGLYRTGRQVDAVRAYHRLRQVLQEVGLDPGPELVALQDAVLRQDPSLEAPAPASTMGSEPAWRKEDLVLVQAGADAGRPRSAEAGLGVAEPVTPAAATGQLPPPTTGAPQGRRPWKPGIVGGAVLVALALLGGVWALMSSSSDSSWSGGGRAAAEQPARVAPSASDAPTPDTAPAITRATTSRFVVPGPAASAGSMQVDARLNEEGQLCTRLTFAGAPRPETCEPLPRDDPFGRAGLWRTSSDSETPTVSFVVVSERVTRVVARRAAQDGVQHEATMFIAREVGAGYAVLYVDRSQTWRLTAYDGQGHELGSMDLARRAAR